MTDDGGGAPADRVVARVRAVLPDGEHHPGAGRDRRRGALGAEVLRRRPRALRAPDRVPRARHRRGHGRAGAGGAAALAAAGLPLAGRHRRVRRDAAAQLRAGTSASPTCPTRGRSRLPRSPALDPAALDAIARSDALLQNMDRTARNPNLIARGRPAPGDRLRRLPLPLARARTRAPADARAAAGHLLAGRAVSAAPCRRSTSRLARPRRRTTGSPPPAATAPDRRRARALRRGLPVGPRLAAACAPQRVRTGRARRSDAHPAATLAWTCDRVQPVQRPDAVEAGRRQLPS